MSGKRSLRIRQIAVIVLITLVVSELSLRGFVMATDVEHQLYQADPDAGWITRPNLRVPIDLDRPPLHFTADTNDLGLRGQAHLGAKRDGEVRVLILGDSFTWGIGADSEDTFPVRLEAMLREETARDVTVVNGGMPNYGTVQELGFYRGHRAALDPDVVVLVFYENDLDDNMVEHVYADGYLFRDPILLFGHPSFVVELIRQRVLMVRGAPVTEGDAMAHTLSLIATLEREVREDGHPFYVATIPSRESTRHRADNESASTYHPLEIAPAIQIEMFDEIDAESESPYLPEHHLNPRGHEIAARAIAEALRAREPMLR